MLKPNILIVEARYHPHVASALLDGATAVLDAAGVSFERLSMPGALEVPQAIALCAQSAGDKNYDGFVALGCVIRGDSYQFELIANETARALMDLGIRDGLCIGNGVLAVESEEQALVLASANGGDAGGDAARACLALVNHRSKLGSRR